MDLLLSPRSLARRKTGVLPDALWAAADAINDRVYSFRVNLNAPHAGASPSALAGPSDRAFFFSGAVRYSAAAILS
jgi:hypothetical protein